MMLNTQKDNNALNYRLTITTEIFFNAVIPLLGVSRKNKPLAILLYFMADTQWGGHRGETQQARNQTKHKQQPGIMKGKEIMFFFMHTSS